MHQQSHPLMKLSNYEIHNTSQHWVKIKLHQQYLIQLLFLQLSYYCCFTIVHPGKHDIDLLKDDEDFVTIMGDILTHILTEKAKADEQIRTDDSEEFNL